MHKTFDRQSTMTSFLVRIVKASKRKCFEYPKRVRLLEARFFFHTFLLCCVPVVVTDTAVTVSSSLAGSADQGIAIDEDPQGSASDGGWVRCITTGALPGVTDWAVMQNLGLLVLLGAY